MIASKNIDILTVTCYLTPIGTALAITGNKSMSKITVNGTIKLLQNVAFEM